jgi:hypothetical protein
MILKGFASLFPHPPERFLTTIMKAAAAGKSETKKKVAKSGARG